MIIVDNEINIQSFLEAVFEYTTVLLTGSSLEHNKWVQWLPKWLVAST